MDPYLRIKIKNKIERYWHKIHRENFSYSLDHIGSAFRDDAIENLRRWVPKMSNYDIETRIIEGRKTYCTVILSTNSSPSSPGLIFFRCNEYGYDMDKLDWSIYNCEKCRYYQWILRSRKEGIPVDCQKYHILQNYIKDLIDRYRYQCE